MIHQAPHYRIDADQGRFLVHLCGELDLATRRELQEVITAYAARPPSPVVVDLSEVTFLDSTGLGLLIALQRAAARNGCTLWVRKVPPHIARVMRMTGIGGVIATELAP